MCVNWNEPQVSGIQLYEQPSALTMLEYELVDANDVCQGIQTYNNCAETHLDGGVRSPFVSRLSAIARAHDPVV